MSSLVCSGAILQCSFGVAPSSLVVLPTNRVLAMTPAATIMDNISIMNIPPFGMCSSILNPAVASATAAALGVLTPMPCVPATVSPWIPGQPNVMIGTSPALTKESILICMWGGIIKINDPGQFKVNLQFPSGGEGVAASAGVNLAAIQEKLKKKIQEKTKEKTKEVNKKVCIKNLQDIQAAQKKARHDDDNHGRLSAGKVKRHLKKSHLTCPETGKTYDLCVCPPKCPSGISDHAL